VEPVVGIVVAIIAAWLLVIAALWIVRPRDVGLREVVRLVPDVLRLARSLLFDRSTPRSVRVALAVLLVWLLSPIDLIPEFIPVLGPLDDAIVAVLVLGFVRRRLGNDALRARWPGTPAGWELLARLTGGTRQA
jgi:uncharacterized membrane protein YkvA (DUF1232 family)